MVKCGGPITVRDVGHRLEIVARVIVIRRPVPACRAEVGIRAAVAMVLHAGFAFTMFGPGLEIAERRDLSNAELARPKSFLFCNRRRTFRIRRIEKARPLNTYRVPSIPVTVMSDFGRRRARVRS
jgi:hypothetical protein